MKELPGPIAASQEQLMEEIRTYDKSLWKKRYQAFHDRYNYLDDKDSGKRVVEQIIKG